MPSSPLQHPGDFLHILLEDDARLFHFFPFLYDDSLVLIEEDIPDGDGDVPHLVHHLVGQKDPVCCCC